MAAINFILIWAKHNKLMSYPFRAFTLVAKRLQDEIAEFHSPQKTTNGIRKHRLTHNIYNILMDSSDFIYSLQYYFHNKHTCEITSC